MVSDHTPFEVSMKTGQVHFQCFNPAYDAPEVQAYITATLGTPPIGTSGILSFPPTLPWRGEYAVARYAAGDFFLPLLQPRETNPWDETYRETLKAAAREYVSFLAQTFMPYKQQLGPIAYHMMAEGLVWDIKRLPSVFLWLKEEYRTRDRASDEARRSAGTFKSEHLFPHQPRVRILDFEVPVKSERPVGSTGFTAGAGALSRNEGEQVQHYTRKEGTRQSYDDRANEIANELIHLAPFHAWVRIGGAEQTIVTNPTPRRDDDATAIAAYVQQRSCLYGTPAEEVDAEIARRRQGSATSGDSATMDAHGDNPPDDRPNSDLSDNFDSPDI
jgi:hypothetical protein